MVVSRMKHITLPLQTTEKIHKTLLYQELTDNEIKQLYAELINVLSMDAVRDFIKFTKEKSEESLALQIRLTKLILNEYNQREKFLLSELQKYPNSMINLFPINELPSFNEELLLPADIMQKFYNVRRLFTLLLDAKYQDKQEFWKRWLCFNNEEQQSDLLLRTPLLSALRKELLINKDRTDFLETIRCIRKSSGSDTLDTDTIFNASLTICKFLVEGLTTADILAQLRIKAMRYEYTEKKSILFLFINSNSIRFAGKIAKYLNKIFESPNEDFFMADFCDEKTDANKEEYDKFYDAFERANRRVYTDEKFRAYNIYPLIIVDRFSIQLNPIYASFFAKRQTI